MANAIIFAAIIGGFLLFLCSTYWIYASICFLVYKFYYGGEMTYKKYMQTEHDC